MKRLIKEALKKAFEPEYEQMQRKIEELQQQNCQLKDRLADLEKDRQRVYDGNKGLMEEINFLKFRNKTLDELHESVVQGTWPHDGSLKTKKCTAPFNRMEILPRGEVYTCCSAFIKHNYFIGNIYQDKDFTSIWNSEKALKLRWSVSNGNFEYCQKRCKYLHNGVFSSSEPFLVPRTQADAARSYRDCRMERSPEYISLTCDESCNLHCASCRSQRKALDKASSDALYEKLVQVVRPMLKDCKYLGGLGSGELFASSACQRFYKTLDAAEFPQLSLYIITNLQLLTEAKWMEFENLHHFPIDLRISIDAACKTTYEKLRRGASWETLLENLGFFKEWRKKAQNKIGKLTFNFVVQSGNIGELEDFCQLAQSYEADEIWLQQMDNWGTYSQEDFKRANPFHAENPLREDSIRLLRSVQEKADAVKVVQNILQEEGI